MSFSHDVYKTQRIVPLRFRRAITGAPVLGKPDIDDHGYYRAAITSGNDHGHVVGVTETKEVIVKVERVQISKNAALFVTSSDTATMTVTDSSGKDSLPLTTEATLKIKGVKAITGANPKTAKVQIRYGTKTGVIIGEISVWVFKEFPVNLTPHRVSISSSTAAAITSRADINAVVEMVKAFWEPCGISFTVDPIKNTSVELATAGRIVLSEIETLFTKNYTRNSINAYFLNQYLGSNNGTLGRGVSRANATAQHLTNPGIIVGDTSASGIDRHTDVHWLANDLAHEIGHFFTLEHVDRKNGSAPRDDTWSVRMLMYPLNKRYNLPGSWQNDVGYGANYRGALITMKNLTDSANAANHSTDGECLIARGVINANGHY